MNARGADPAGTGPDGLAAPWLSAVAEQAAMELRLTLRRGENLLAMVGIPGGMFLLSSVFVWRGAAPVLSLTLTVALVASGLVNTGIATAYERGYGVLKRLGGSPLGRSGLVAAKVAVVLLIAVLQVAALALLAGTDAFGERASWAGLLLTTLVGATTFAGFGLLIAGTFRPEAALVVANVLFLVAIGLAFLAAFGGLPDGSAPLLRWLPTFALSSAFEIALGGVGDLLQPLAVVSAWGVVALVAAARSFRWE